MPKLRPAPPPRGIERPKAPPASPSPSRERTRGHRHTSSVVLPVPLPAYLTHVEAAVYLRLSPRSLDNLVERGHLHPVRSGARKRLYAVATLDKYLRHSLGGRLRA